MYDLVFVSTISFIKTTIHLKSMNNEPERSAPVIVAPLPGPEGPPVAAVSPVEAAVFVAPEVGLVAAAPPAVLVVATLAIREARFVVRAALVVAAPATPASASIRSTESAT